MCTYHGIIEEYPLISIDSFESHNYTCTTFFITHIHLDHLVGLERPEFARYLQKNNLVIYCSELSKELLITMSPFQHLEKFFKVVPIDQPFALTLKTELPAQAKQKKSESDDIEYTNSSTSLTSSSSARILPNTNEIGETIFVTCFGSGHCPGSVMIFIEGPNGNVLFTGDFRLYIGQSKRLVQLHQRRCSDEKGNDDNYVLKPIDKLYIDMTFFRPDILYIPTREIACDALILFIKSILANSSTISNIYFKTSARTGYEQCYRQMYDELKMKIHVEQSQFDFYACLPSIQECLTTDPFNTRLHACRTSASNFAQPCAFFKNCEKPIRVLLSIMWFAEQIAADKLLVEYHKYHSNFENSQSSSKKYFLGYEDYGGEGVDVSYSDKYLTYRLCYSLHSSFSEIIDVLKTLRPKSVVPIAAPPVSQLSTKKLFQIINRIIDPNKIKATIQNQQPLIHRKPIVEKLQIKRRYQSFDEDIKKNIDETDCSLQLDTESDRILLNRVNSLTERKIKQPKFNTTLFRSISTEIPKQQFFPIKSVLDEKVDLNVNQSTSVAACFSLVKEEPQFLPTTEIETVEKDEKNIVITTPLTMLNHPVESMTTSIYCDEEGAPKVLIEKDEFVLPLISTRKRTTSNASSSDTVDYEFDNEICDSRALLIEDSIQE
ncbi:unnamed protein product [Didymodactylos carnosus]|uniref:Protein artemis n=1 Tax=Didymodactylos carnosus TaxID=1234261 RepID=A0A813NX82_9BILA|nr:unnamed protein product [Didymodactylos carnosus]CAF0899206.1 unnamed protein product [Didymodactylos carnosus]CAF3521297.1 unnamed protein product [Didymodactylos carnosus]CAF3680268.1 unnamed protein product [Didymodactylos carnosus]